MSNKVISFIVAMAVFLLLIVGFLVKDHYAKEQEIGTLQGERDKALQELTVQKAYNDLNQATIAAHAAAMAELEHKQAKVVKETNYVIQSNPDWASASMPDVSNILCNQNADSAGTPSAEPSTELCSIQ